MVSVSRECALAFNFFYLRAEREFVSVSRECALAFNTNDPSV
jgi:hypothetical protein